MDRLFYKSKELVMRVMCICEKWNPAPNCENLPEPKYGDIDTVIGTMPDPIWGIREGYELERFIGIWFSAKRFIPLSDDEPEIYNEKMKEVDLDKSFTKLKELV